MKKTTCRSKGWADGPLSELHRTIDAERESARWLEMARALSCVEAAIEEERKAAVAAIEAEKRLAKVQKLASPNKVMAHEYPRGHRGEGSGTSAIVKGRRLKQDKRNRKRRAAYVKTGRKPGRPRIYPGGRAGHGGNHLNYKGEWVY